ncbi:hypothetical protein V6N12_043037 [Hibiscus sabdariffa]|uniref:Uncharacterized protein n=1 Tax=Hibiscus sabdariffa TaxID=183260 RepID=A0ABR2DI10_9ROSI
MLSLPKFMWQLVEAQQSTRALEEAQRMVAKSKEEVMKANAQVEAVNKKSAKERAEAVAAQADELLAQFGNFTDKYK